MARSIHTTRKTLAKLVAQSADAQKLEKAGAALRRKRRLKRTVRKERRRSVAPLAHSDVSTIPIEILDQATHVFHALSVADVRALLKRLPHAARDGISRIQLSLGSEMQREHADGDQAPDPVTGRLGMKRMPGIYSGHVLGCYSPRNGDVSVFAFVIDEQKLVLPRVVCDIYLRLHAGKTLVHEIAHHHDATSRVRRGRWLADRTENAENYAERMEHEWTQRVLVPYLESTYPQEVEQLLDWVGHHGGLRLSLGFFAGDPRCTRRDGLIRLVLSASGGFEEWIEKAQEWKSLSDSRLGFGWGLHYADQYEECLRVADLVLASESAHMGALVLKADTLVHLDRLDEALALADEVVRREPTEERAWKVRGDVFEARQNWRALLENSDGWLALPENTQQKRYALLHRAIAYCGLNKEEEMDEALAVLLATGFMRNAAIARKLVFRRAGR